jgi:hypothetical protein
VRVEGLSLKYYKDNDGKFEKSLGSIDLSKAEFVRPLSEDEVCLLFEVHDEGDKTYKFQSATHKEMLHWVASVEKLIEAYKSKIQQEFERKLAEETPLRIKWFDEEGEEYWLREIGADLNSMYPDPASTEDTLTIRQHLDCANEVVGYLTDFVPEVQRCDRRPARFDILAMMLTIVNNFLGQRLCTFLSISDETEERSQLVEFANLGDLHAILDWLTRYQSTLKGIRCPVLNAKDPIPSPATTILSTKYLTPKQCILFDAIPGICRLYAYGGSLGAKGGASVHLYDHCVKVWNNCIASPEEMLQRRNDGTFFTHTPVDMWEAINMHISLATSTRSPILHVMMADKVVAALNDVFDMIIQFIKTVDSSTLETGLKDVELEFFCALANDTALHIEEVVNLIDQFDYDEIRTKIDDIFEPLTTTLVNCGQACLKRLSRMVMQDIQALLDEVFQEDWIEGNQMHVATATIVDYMNDFEEFLVKFWSNKFLDTILEEMVVSYTRSLLFRKSYGSISTVSTTTPIGGGQTNGGHESGFMSSFFQKTKTQITQTITQTIYTPSHVPVDEESLGRLAQDVNILNSFFSTKTDQERASDYLAILNEVSILLFVDLNGLIDHMMKCVKEIPSAILAVKEVAIAAMRMRPNSFQKQDIERFLSIVHPMISEADHNAQGLLTIVFYVNP